MPDDISEANELDFFTYFHKVRLYFEMCCYY